MSPKFNPDRENIQNLSLEVSKEASRLPFDPEKDLSPEEMQFIERELSYRLTDSGFARNASCVKIGLPKFFNPETVTDTDWQKMKSGLDKWRPVPGKNWRNRDYFVWLARDMKTLFPERAAGLRLDDKIWEGVRSRRLEEFQGGNFLHYITDVKDMKILFPKKEDLADFTTEEFYKKALEELRKSKDLNLAQYCNDLASMRLIFPDEYHEFAPTQEDWKSMISFFKNLSGKGILNLEMIRNFAILSSEKVEVTERGIELTLADRRAGQVIPPIPQQKQF